MEKQNNRNNKKNNGFLNFEKIKSLVHEFFEELRYQRKLSDCTLKSYESDLKQFFSFWKNELVKTKRLGFEIAAEMFAKSLLYDKDISKASIARKFACFKTLQVFLQKKNFSCSFQFKAPKVTKQLPTVLTESEILTILNYEEPGPFGLRNKAIAELLYATGIRCQELINLRIENVFWGDRAIKIVSGKGNKDRFVIFGKFAEKKLKEYLDNRKTQVTKENYLFVGKGESKLNERAVQRIVEKYKDLFPGKNLTISPHAFRHSFATHLLSRGASLSVVQKLLGHSSVLTTEIYTQISQKELTDFIQQNHPVQKIIKSKC